MPLHPVLVSCRQRLRHPWRCQEVRAAAVADAAWKAVETKPGMAWFAAVVQDAANRLWDDRLPSDEVARRLAAMRALVALVEDENAGVGRVDSLELAAAASHGYHQGWPAKTSSCEARPLRGTGWGSASAPTVPGEPLPPAHAAC